MKESQITIHKKTRFKLFLCVQNMKDGKLAFGNLSYILEKLTFLLKFGIFASILGILLTISMTLWIKCPEIHVGIFLCECILRNKFYTWAN